MSYTFPIISALNPNAKEFKPQFPIKTTKQTSPKKYSLIKTRYENIMFEKLEKDFIKNNEWLFLV